MSQPLCRQFRILFDLPPVGHPADFDVGTLPPPEDVLDFRQNLSLATSLFGKITGQLCTFFWGVVLFSHILISIDRMVSIIVPIKRGCLRACFQTRVLVTFPWILAFVTVGHFFACSPSLQLASISPFR